MRLKSAIAGLCLLISTSVVAQGNSAHAAAARYEAESAAASCVGTIDANRSGFSGTGFCNTDNAVGAHAQFAVSAATAGTATLGIRFANGGTTARPADVLVDGATVQSVSFEPTGSWSSWATKTLTVPVSAGDHIIRIRSAAATGLPNIDYLDFNLGGGLPGSFQWSSSEPKHDSCHIGKLVVTDGVVGG
jgi:hypothetical protein